MSRNGAVLVDSRLRDYPWLDSLACSFDANSTSSMVQSWWQLLGHFFSMFLIYFWPSNILLFLVLRFISFLLSSKEFYSYYCYVQSSRDLVLEFNLYKFYDFSYFVLKKICVLILWFSIFIVNFVFKIEVWLLFFFPWSLVYF